ncbi:phosphoribosyltransferase [Streptomyces sp. PU-14G]|uniref:phosphoribosyltransferase n=1 Tax=Streptomyces sp. PU-14G TaxID=2800808 RepID=UPI0034DF52AC
MTSPEDAPRTPPAVGPLEPITVIDDIRAAAARLSPLGRRLLGGDIDRFAARLAALAEENGWTLVGHDDFTAWTEAELGPRDVAVVLDKLAQHSSRMPARCVPVGTHRHLRPDGGLRLELVGLPQDFAETAVGARVSVVDDAAYTGDTLCAVLKLLAGAGAQVERVLVAVSSSRAEQRLSREMGMRTSAFLGRPVRGDVIHARDAYPWLPFSGRAADTLSTAPLSARIAPLLYNGGRWLSHPALMRDRLLRELAVSVVDRLRSFLGREPVASDVTLFGPSVAVPLPGPVEVRPDTPLRTVIEAPSST